MKSASEIIGQFVCEPLFVKWFKDHLQALVQNSAVNSATLNKTCKYPQGRTPHATLPDVYRAGMADLTPWNQWIEFRVDASDPGKGLLTVDQLSADQAWEIVLGFFDAVDSADSVIKSETPLWTDDIQTLFTKYVTHASQHC